MTALGELFKGALANAVGQNGVAIFDYGDTADFARLWDAEHSTPSVLSELDGELAVIIVWDGRVRNEHDGKEKLLAPHLTPLDWALAFSIKVLGDTKTTNRSNFHIHIVDLTGKAHDEWAMRMRYQLLAEMPWVTLHAPLIPEKNGEVASYRRGYRPILEDGGLLIPAEGAWRLNLEGKAQIMAQGINQERGKNLIQALHARRRCFLMHELQPGKPFATAIRDVTNTIMSDGAATEVQRTALARTWVEVQEHLRPLPWALADPVVADLSSLILDLDCWVQKACSGSLDLVFKANAGLDRLEKIVVGLLEAESSPR